MLTFYYRRECYGALGLSTESTEAEVKRRYRQLSLLYHPGNYFKLNLLLNFIRICILDKNSNPNANAVQRRLIEIYNKVLAYYETYETLIISDSDEEKSEDEEPKTEESEEKAEESEEPKSEEPSEETVDKTEEKTEDDTKKSDDTDKPDEDKMSDEWDADGRVSNLHLSKTYLIFNFRMMDQNFKRKSQQPHKVKRKRAKK